MKIIDQTNDPGFATLHTLVAEFPKMASVAGEAELDISEFTKLADEDFAWPEQRMFPIHNREHTAISLAYSKLASYTPEYVADTLYKAASVYNISLEEVFSTDNTKEASLEEVYLLPEIQRFIYKEASDIPALDDALQRMRNQLTPGQQIQASSNLNKLAEYHSIPVSEQTMKQAGVTTTRLTSLVDWLEARGTAANKLGSSSAPYNALTTGITSTSGLSMTPSEQHKLASFIGELDQESGVDIFYGSLLPDPMQTVFNTNISVTKLAALDDVLTNDTLLQKLPLTFWTDALGSDILPDITSTDGKSVDLQALKTVLATLPADVKQTLKKQLVAYA